MRREIPKKAELTICKILTVMPISLRMSFGNSSGRAIGFAWLTKQLNASIPGRLGIDGSRDKLPKAPVSQRFTLGTDICDGCF